MMMKVFLLGAAIGYVFGTRAGRERYEEMLRAYRKVLDHPAVQGAAGIARAKIGEKTGFGTRTEKASQQHNGHLDAAEPATATYPRP
jgi:hypothetical protein